MWPKTRIIVPAFLLLLGLSMAAPAVAAPSNPLCPGRGHGTDLCPNIGSSGGDVSGPYYLPRVVGVQNTPASPLGPTPGQFFQFIAGMWTPATFTAAGDLSGGYPNFVVRKVQGFPVSPTVPAVAQVLAWDGAQYAPTTLPASAGDIFIGGEFTPTNPLTPLTPQFMGAAEPNFFTSLSAGLMVRNARTASGFLVGFSNINAAGTITFDLLMSTDDGASYPLVATATIAPGARVGFAAMALSIPTNARLLVRVTTSAGLTALGGASATISSP